MLIIPNCRFIHPFAEEISVEISPNDGLKGTDDNTYPLVPSRHSQYFSMEAADTTVVTLPWNPTVNEWTEIYLDGIRIANITTDFGIHYNPYTINQNVITFTSPLTGTLEVFCDNTLAPGVRDSNVINFDNIQGAETTATLPDQTFAATWCEPFVCAQPYHGYVRMTDDRKSLMYIPNQFFYGNDSFSYAYISQRGQLSKPKCVFISVPSPPPPPTN